MKKIIALFFVAGMLMFSASSLVMGQDNGDTATSGTTEQVAAPQPDAAAAKTDAAVSAVARNCASDPSSSRRKIHHRRGEHQQSVFRFFKIADDRIYEVALL